MRCSGCGKNIPFGGQVCPYCHRDKSSDQAQALIPILGFGGAFLGLLIGGGWGAAILGGIGWIVGLALASKSPQNSSRKPPEVQIVNAEPEEDRTVSESDLRSRLTTLESLRAEGLISEAEFNLKRSKILEKL